MKAFQISYKYSKRAKANLNRGISDHFPIANRTMTDQSSSEFFSSHQSDWYPLQLR